MTVTSAPGTPNFGSSGISEETVGRIVPHLTGDERGKIVQMSANTMAPVIEPIETLITSWCDRRELKALAILLPAWVNNFGLTDGWTDVLDALVDLRGRPWLIESDRQVIEQAIVLVQRALDRR